MGLFVKAKKHGRWLTIGFHGEGVYAGSVERQASAKPVVQWVAFYSSKPMHSSDILEKAGKELQIHAYRCTTLLGGGEYQLLTIEAPPVPAEELKTAVRWRLKDMLDFHVDDATIDVLDIPADKNAPVRTHSMFVVAARNSVIEQRQGLFTAAKIGLSVIDIPEMAQRNISALLEPEGRGLAMLSFNADGGLLTVTFHAELYLSRRIEVTLAQLFDTDADRKQTCYDKITLELQRSLDHFDRQYHFITVVKLILAPIGVDGLLEFLAANLYMPVERMDLADVMDLSKVPDLQDAGQQQRFFLTLGAALRHEEVVL